MSHILRFVLNFWIFALSGLCMSGQVSSFVVTDSLSGHPLHGASIFDCNGSLIGISDSGGHTPAVSLSAYPVVVRFLGYGEKCVTSVFADTVPLSEIPMELPEVEVGTQKQNVLYMQAYVREYSTLTTYSDTVFLFREKVVDYAMTPPGRKMRFNGWGRPRVLKSKSYYRFSDDNGLDSVSDVCSYHFSWSDWIVPMVSPHIPASLRNTDCGVDSLFGRYGASEIWNRNNSRITVDVNILADTLSRKWVPDLRSFFRSGLDYEHFRIRVSYDNVAGDSILPPDLSGYSYNIESNGRGLDLFMFHGVNEPYFVSTYAEVYFIDKEYISVKEARKRSDIGYVRENLRIEIPEDAPPLQESVKLLMARVNSIDRNEIRTSLPPDQRLVSKFVGKHDFGTRMLNLLKDLTGISNVRFNRNINNHWKDFRRDQVQKNNADPGESGNH